MAKLYYWEPTRENVGHVSLELSDGQYISHWPGTNIEKKLQALKTYSALQMPTLGDDINSEKCKPHQTLSIPEGLLDEDIIKKWWKNYTENANYNMVSENCAHAVSECIRIGLEVTLTHLHNHNFSWSLAKRPKEVYDQVMALKSKAKTILAEREAWDKTKSGKMWRERSSAAAMSPAFWNGFNFPGENDYPFMEKRN